jgi:hypothetical protein
MGVLFALGWLFGLHFGLDAPWWGALAVAFAQLAVWRAAEIKEQLGTLRSELAEDDDGPLFAEDVLSARPYGGDD